MTKTIVLSSDHAAVDLRLAIARHLTARGFTVTDLGPATAESVHYPAQAQAAAERVASGAFDLGILLCGTGQGIMMAANKVRGIRCGVCADPYSAAMTRAHNNANMLALGARVLGEGLALAIVDAFVDTEFEGGRHATRVDMITALEG